MEEGDSVAHRPLEGNFGIYGQKNGSCHVKLDNLELTVTKNVSDTNGKKYQVLATKDVVGCVCMKAGEKEQKKHAAFFSIYSYPLVGPSKKKQKRTRVAVTLEVDEKESFEENLEIANRWKEAVLGAAKRTGELIMMKMMMDKEMNLGI